MEIENVTDAMAMTKILDTEKSSIKYTTKKDMLKAIGILEGFIKEILDDHKIQSDGRNAATRALFLANAKVEHLKRDLEIQTETKDREIAMFKKEAKCLMERLENSNGQLVVVNALLKTHRDYLKVMTDRVDSEKSG